MINKKFYNKIVLISSIFLLSSVHCYADYYVAEVAYNKKKLCSAPKPPQPLWQAISMVGFYEQQEDGIKDYVMQDSNKDAYSITISCISAENEEKEENEKGITIYPHKIKKKTIICSGNSKIKFKFNPINPHEKKKIFYEALIAYYGNDADTTLDRSYFDTLDQTLELDSSILSTRAQRALVKIEDKQEDYVKAHRAEVSRKQSIVLEEKTRLVEAQRRELEAHDAQQYSETITPMVELQPDLNRYRIIDIEMGMPAEVGNSGCGGCFSGCFGGFFDK